MYSYQSFSNFLDLKSSSSWILSNLCWALRKSLSSCCSYSSKSRSLLASFSSSFWVFFNSFYCFLATSIAYEPTTIFSSIFLSLFISFCYFVFDFSSASSLFLISSSNFFFSSSSKFAWLSICCFSCSAFFLISSFSYCNLLSNSFIFSLSSTCTIFSTTFPMTPFCFKISLGSKPWFNNESYCLSLVISSWYSLRRASFGSSLIFG